MTYVVPSDLLVDARHDRLVSLVLYIARIAIRGALPGLTGLPAERHSCDLATSWM
jgi:hypothetical protein